MLRLRANLGIILRTLPIITINYFPIRTDTGCASY